MSNLFHVSERDHSALVLMSALAERFSGRSFTSLQEIADSMRLSQGYLEEIAAALKKAGLIQGRQGPNGGYRLVRKPASISLEEILTAIEGPIELVECQKEGISCPVEGGCASKHVWNVLQKAVRSSLRATTLANVVE